MENSANNPLASPEKKEEEVFLIQISSERLALSLTDVVEVLTMEKIYPLPTVPPHILGVILWKMELLPVVDLGILLEVGESGSLAPKSTKSRLMVVSRENESFALYVDSILNIGEVNSQEIHPIPSSSANKGVFQIGRSVLYSQGKEYLLLDRDKIFEMARPK